MATKQDVPKVQSKCNTCAGVIVEDVAQEYIARDDNLL